MLENISQALHNLLKNPRLIMKIGRKNVFDFLEEIFVTIFLAQSLQLQLVSPTSHEVSKFDVHILELIIDYGEEIGLSGKLNVN